ncbi:hypothetical protein AHAS_Ahas16G0113900 [Arachis hypogaea]
MKDGKITQCENTLKRDSDFPISHGGEKEEEKKDEKNDKTGNKVMRQKVNLFKQKKERVVELDFQCIGNISLWNMEVLLFLSFY